MLLARGIAPIQLVRCDGRRRTENDEVLGDAGVDDVHGPHGAARIVKHPLLLDVDVRRQLGAQLVDNVLDGAARVAAVAVDAALGQVLQVV